MDQTFAKRSLSFDRPSPWYGVLVLSALVLAASLLIGWGASAAPLRPTRAQLNPEFVAYQEALAAMALPRTVTEDGHALGLIPNPVDLSHMTGLLPQPFGDRTPRGFPATYDLRTLGRVTVIRDQGSCGSCWSFAGLASLESWLLTGPVETWDFSENNLKECHGFDWGACDGGNSSMVTAYLARRSGPVRESDDPYKDYPVGCTSGLTVQKIVRDVLFFPDRSGSLDNDTLKQAITTYGAISTDLYWVSGSYKAATRAYYYSGAAGANHAVDLVGWNDAYSRTDFQSAPAGDGAWIVRNSWGAGWGDAGYFYVSYYDARIGQGNVAAVNAVAPDGTTVYQYDPLGWITNWGYGSTTAWGANVFTASSAGEIRSVATYASTVNTTYQILVKSALNGTTLATKTGTWPLAGFHTVDLNTPVPVSAGQTFVIAVRYTTPAYNFPIPAECQEAGYSSGAAASAGQSYISSDGSSWTDITTALFWGDPTCNVCIKAVVGPDLAPPTLVGNFTASDGEDSLATLAWTNPADSDLAQVVVLRKTGSYPTSHTDGTNVYTNSSPTPGATVSSTNIGLTNGTTYYYAVFSRDIVNSWNDTVTPGSNADTAAPVAAVPSVNPIGYWRFNEASGATALDSAGTNPGTITGATRIAGSPDSTTALSFSGPGQYVRVLTAASLNFSGPFTVEAWIKASVLSSFHAIVVKRGGTGYTEAAYGLWTYGNKLYAEIKNYNRSSYASLTGNTTLIVGTWTHVALRRDVAGEVSLWVNGVKQTMTAVVTGALNPPGDLYIGRHNYNSSEDFAGSIDEVRIHNRALDPGEFNLLPSGPAPTPPALVTNFTASDGANAQSTLAWTNPADSDLAQVVILRKTGSYPTSHTDGTSVYDNASPTPGAPVSRINTGLINGMTYYYAVFSKDSGNLWNDTVTAGSNADAATPSATASNGPVGYWRFNEASGTTALDSSGNLCTGAMIGATRVGGSPDGTTALSLSGSGQYVQIATCVAPYFGGAFTLEAWIKPSVLTGLHAIAVKRGTSVQATYGLWTSGDKLYGVVYNFDRSSGAELLGNTSLFVGVWAHVALRRDVAGEVSLWVNGVKQTMTAVVTGNANPPGDLYIGRHDINPSEDFAGSIDEVRIHNRVLDLAEFNLLPTPAPSPPALVTNFTASDGANAQSVLAWTNPADSDLAQVVVLRKTGSYPTSHTDGTNVYDNSSPTPAAAVSTVNTGLTNGTTYYYAVFSRDTGNLWNDTVTAGSNADTATPSATPPAGDVMGYWRFNDGSGPSAADASGNGNTGTITGATWASGSPDGSTALAFNGSGQFVRVGSNASLEFSGPFTIEAWIKASVLSSFHAIVVRRGGTGYTEAAYGLWTYGNKLYAEIKNYNRSSYASLTGNTTLIVGTWTHVALRRDVAGEVSLWVNGVKQTMTAIVTGNANPPGDLYIGRHNYNSSEDFAGSIDEVRIHNRALDPAEFNLLPSGPAPTPPALVTTFTASDGANAQSTLAWTNPADSDLAQVVILRKTGSYPTSHTDGTNVYDNSSPTPAAAVSTVNTGLTNSTTYYYAVFARDTGNLWNDTVTAGSNADTATPSAAPPVGDVMGYWRFNEGSGPSAADASANGNTGTITGATWASGSPDGSTALAFNGSGQYVLVPTSTSLNFSGPFTIEAWIKASVLSSFHAIVVKRGGTGYTEAAYGLWTYGNKLYAEIKNYNRSSYASLTGNTTLIVGTWTHVALRRDVAGEVSLWVNGVKQTMTAVVTGALNPPGDLYIGRHNYNSSEDFAGSIDEVRIHNRALDPAEFNLLPRGLSGAPDNAPASLGGPLAYPNPVRTFPVMFGSRDASAASILVRIYDLTGTLVFDSGWRDGASIEWDGMDTRGDLASNGVYLYTIRTRSSAGSEREGRPQKLFVLRD